LRYGLTAFAAIAEWWEEAEAALERLVREEP
jgi:hypothetical protein